MKQTFLIKENRPNLVLFFAGWGMDENPFRHLIDRCPEDADWMICYDYTEIEFDSSLVEGYKEIYVYGWSLGVLEAQKVMDTHSLPITLKVAINGTACPINKYLGISPKLYNGTMIGFTEIKLQKFRKRMTHSSTAYNEFIKMAPQRDLKSLQLELIAFFFRSLIPDFNFDLEGRNAQWDLVIIGKHDRIFPLESQILYWYNNAKRLGVADIAHYDANLPFLEDDQYFVGEFPKHG